MKQKNIAIEELLRLRSLSKFEVDGSIFYPGLEDERIKNRVTDLVNRCIDDFITLVKINGDEKNFHQAIRKGLSYFEVLDYTFEAEDRERVCAYFEEMMDAIGLESSGGILTKWMYGFDIKQKPVLR